MLHARYVMHHKQRVLFATLVRVVIPGMIRVIRVKIVILFKAVYVTIVILVKCVMQEHKLAEVLNGYYKY